MNDAAPSNMRWYLFLQVIASGYSGPNIFLRILLAFQALDNENAAQKPVAALTPTSTVIPNYYFNR